MTIIAADDRPERLAAPGYRLQDLGGLRLMAADGRAIELRTRKSALLLAYLAVPAGSVHARDRLAGLLWPSSGQGQARGSLRHAIAALRKLIGSDAIEGEALDEWLVFERTRSRGVQQAALQRTVDTLLAEGWNAEAIAAAEQLVALDPLREQSHRVLMHAYLRAGERSKALTQFRRLEEALLAELGVASSPQSAALADEIRRATAADVQRTAPKHDQGAARSPRSGNASVVPRMTIAVLPFQCPDADAMLAAFADGFSSDLVAGLSRTPEFSVIAWQSSAQVSGRASDAVQSATELSASHALTGSLRLIEGRMRITTQLISAGSRAWIWAERYDVDADEVLSTQDSIVAGIMGAIDAGVRRAEREAARAKQIADLDAWSRFHRGMWYVYRFTSDDVTAAEQLFCAAIWKDASAAGPHAGLAYASIVKILWRFTDDLCAALAEGLAHACNALARDEHDADVHTVLGRLLAMSGQVQQGIAHLERAVELNASHAHAHYGLAYALFVAGMPDTSLDPLAVAMRLSPKDPMSSMFNTMAAFCHLMFGDLQAAETAARRASTLLSRLTSSRLALAAVLQIRGHGAGARAALAEAREIDPQLSLSTVAPLVQYIPERMRNHLLAALATAGLPAM